MSDSAVHSSEDIPVELDKFWTVSNAFSVLRMVLAVPVVWLIILGPAFVWPTFALVVVMIISDILDGHLARRRNEITRWGKILDPLADKVAIGAITLVLVFYKDLPFWVIAAVLIRDGLILLASMFLIGKKDVVVSSNIWGKLTTLLMSFLLVSFLMDLFVIQTPLLWACGVLLLVSWLSYLINFIQLIKSS